MPLALPPTALKEVQHNLTATPSTSPGTQVTGAGTAHTKGSWASLIDPVPYDSHMLALAIFATSVSATQTDSLLDIGIGPSGGGSEQVILPNLLAGWTGSL